MVIRWLTKHELAEQLPEEAARTLLLVPDQFLPRKNTLLSERLLQ